MSKSNAKRIPPWEKARIIVHMQEQERKRKLLDSQMNERQRTATYRAKRPSPLDSLEENKKRLAEIRKRIEQEQAK